MPRLDASPRLRKRRFDIQIVVQVGQQASTGAFGCVAAQLNLAGSWDARREETSSQGHRIDLTRFRGEQHPKG